MNKYSGSVQFNSITQSSLTVCNPMDCRMPGYPTPSPTPRVYSNSCLLSRWGRPAISSSVVPFSSCPQSLPALGSFPIRWPKYWSFSLSTSPSNEHPGLISFRMDWLDLLAVQGTLKNHTEIILWFEWVSDGDSVVSDSATPWTHQAPQSMELSRQEYWILEWVAISSCSS